MLNRGEVHQAPEVYRPDNRCNNAAINGSALQWFGFQFHIQKAEPKYASNEEFPLCTHVEVFNDG
jgi:hypothetical protein